MTKQTAISKLVYRERIVWPREMKLLNELMKEYPEIHFWNNLDLGFQLNSLAWLKTEKGQETIQSKYNSWIEYKKRIAEKIS